MKKFLIKKFLISVGIFAASWLILFVIINWKYCFPMGQWTAEDDVEVEYTIPSVSAGVITGFHISGDVELVRFIPNKTYPDKNGFVNLKIKTSKGWFESPIASVGGPIDWEKGVRVSFTYPQSKVLREYTADLIMVRRVLLGILPETVAGWGCPPIEGDIARIYLMYNNNGSIDCTTERTTGLKHHAYGDGISKEIVEISVSTEETKVK